MPNILSGAVDGSASMSGEVNYIGYEGAAATSGKELVGSVALGKSGGYANPLRLGEVTIYADKWIGSASPYSQIVSIAGVTPYSQVDLTPSVEQLTVFHNKDLAFVTENENGVVTVYAIGDKPQNDYTIQATIKEVTA